MKLMRQLALGSVIFLLAYGPFYRYFRGLTDLSFLTFLPYAVLGFTLVLGCTLLLQWRQHGTTRVDRAVEVFAILISLCFLHALAFHPMESAIKILKAYLLPLGVFFAVRSFTVEKINGLIKLAAIASLLSVFALCFEFYQLNVEGLDPRQSIVAVAYTRSDDFDPREYQAYFAQEAWKLPLVGYIVRPFGLLGAPQISGVYYTFMFWVTYFLIGPKGSFLRLLCLSFFLVGTLLTASRTAMLGLVVIAMIVAFKSRRRHVSIPMVLTLLSAFFLAMYPSFEALLDAERHSGFLNSAVFLKDVLLFFTKEFNAVMQLNFLDLLFGAAKSSSVEAFAENGIISIDYYLNELTDVGILQVILEIGLLPAGAIVWAFWVAHTTFLKADVLNEPLRRMRGTFVFAMWTMLLVGSIHYLAITVYCLNVVIMLMLAYISVQSHKETQVRFSPRLKDAGGRLPTGAMACVEST